MQPLVSVLMPCFNVEKYIRFALDSIVNQTYKNLEIILINDGSSDNTGMIMDEYAKTDDRIVSIHNPVNLGLIKTLNIGVDRANGKFIARMDADDISQAGRIEILLKVFEENPEMDIISAGTISINTTGKIMRFMRPRATLPEALKFVSFFCTPVNHPCVMAKAEVLKKNYYDENFLHSEDYELFSRLLFNDSKIMNVENPLYYLRVNPESVSNKYEKIQISTHTTISRRNIENYFREAPDFFLHKVMINRISFTVKPALLKEAFQRLESMKQEFISREHSSPEMVKQINEFLTEQKIDILLQSIKKSDWQNLPGLLFEFIKNIKLFFDPRGYSYFKSKLKF